jgi:phosphate transport system substrate-binding protein
LPPSSGIVPSTETIANGEYPVSRPLFFYVKKAHLGVIPGLKEYVSSSSTTRWSARTARWSNTAWLLLPMQSALPSRKAFGDGKTM